MNWQHTLKRLLRVPRLTVVRACVALAISVGADGLQLITGMFGWEGPDQVIDFVAMTLTSWLLGFHILLLPTFVVELIPVLDDLPTWTACTIAVIVVRRREQRTMAPPQPSPPRSLPPLPTGKDGA
ncbi:MAG: hypothetical protein ABSE48_19635 [Verrucomicrobiota bacterium]|jgi:hypothetical protein